MNGLLYLLIASAVCVVVLGLLLRVAPRDDVEGLDQ